MSGALRLNCEMMSSNIQFAALVPRAQGLAPQVVLLRGRRAVDLERDAGPVRAGAPLTR